VITCATEHLDGFTLVHLSGSFDLGAVPARLVEELYAVHAPGPLVIDLTDVTELDRPAVRELILLLENGARRRSVVLVDSDLESRRALRSHCRLLSVLPTVEHAIDPRTSPGARVAGR